ncbi:MAG: DUF4932 domain-containing protein [Alistipes sp.]|nr:DUF4932 domain-containing protein [Alistipes sp.]
MATLIFALLTCFWATAQDSSVLEKPRIDRNVELMSIVWRLAGSREYSNTHFQLYTDRIDNHFGEYKRHEMVCFAREIRSQYGVSYNAVPQMAMHLNGDLNLRSDITDNELDPRWKDVDKERFTTLLKQFAADTEANRFFDDNAELYAGATERFLPVYEAVDLKWYTNFFGAEPQEKFAIVNGLGFGSSNYGGAVEYTDGRKEVYAFMGAWSVDEAGMVDFPMGEYIPILLHEFNHSFVNPLTAVHRESFREVGEMFYATLRRQMSSQAYSNWEIMLNEALVRAAVIKYMKDHGVDSTSVAGLVQMEKSKGFGWIEPLVAELDKYAAAREEYPTLDDYMPRLAEAYREWAEVIAARQAAANN